MSRSPTSRTATSTITVSGLSGNAPATLAVDVDIKHTYRGDLVVDLIAPDGTAYHLQQPQRRQRRQRDQDLHRQRLLGGRERRLDAYASPTGARSDVGQIDKWSLQF